MKVTAPIAGGILVAVSAILVTWQMSYERVPTIDRKWISAVPLTQVETGKQFSATVDGVHYGFLDSKMIGSTSAYVIILLKTTDGKEFSLYQMHPSTNFAAIADSLVMGKDYKFPDILK